MNDDHYQVEDDPSLVWAGLRHGVAAAMARPRADRFSGVALTATAPRLSTI